MDNATLVLMKLLYDDFKQASLRLSSSPEDGFVRRTFVRTSLAIIEGEIGLFKLMALSAALPSRSALSLADVAILREEGYAVAGGHARTKPLRISIPDNVRFTFGALARAHALDLVLDCAAEGWKRFLRAVAIRNRITHPRTSGDLDATDGDLRDVMEGCDWVSDQFLKLVAEMNRLGGSSSRHAASERHMGRAVVIRRIEMRPDPRAVHQSRLVYRCEKTNAEYETLHTAISLDKLNVVWCRGCQVDHILEEEHPTPH